MQSGEGVHAKEGAIAKEGGISKEGAAPCARLLLVAGDGPGEVEFILVWAERKHWFILTYIPIQHEHLVHTWRCTEVWTVNRITG